jgi:Protein kinase domain
MFHRRTGTVESRSQTDPQPTCLPARTDSTGLHLVHLLLRLNSSVARPSFSPCLPSPGRMAEFEPEAVPESMRSRLVNGMLFLEAYKDCHFPLGQGSFGVVSRYRCRATGQLRAIKAQTILEDRDMTAWLREEHALEAAAQSSNPDARFVVRLFASCLCPLADPPSTHDKQVRSYLVLEHCEFNLEQVLQSHVGTSLPDALRWTYHLFCGLSFLHSRLIVHRDLKPSNTLLAETSPHMWDLKLSDLGTSRAVSQMMTASVVALPYRAPEILLGTPTQAGPLGSQQHNIIRPSSASVADMLTIVVG